MIDIWDWEEEARLDALLAPHRWCAYPPGLLEAHIARKMAMHRAMAVEIERLLANGQNQRVQKVNFPVR